MKRGTLRYYVDPRGIKISCPDNRWLNIKNRKHIYMKGNKSVVRNTILDPDEIYRSSISSTVEIYYRDDASASYYSDKKTRFTVVVCEIDYTSKTGCLVTTYATDEVGSGNVDVQGGAIYVRSLV